MISYRTDVQYFRFQWQVSGSDSCSYERTTHDIVVFMQAGEYLNHYKMAGSGVYYRGETEVEDLQQGFNFEQFCRYYRVDPEMPVYYGGEIGRETAIAKALLSAGLPEEIEVPAYGGKDVKCLYTEEIGMPY